MDDPTFYGGASTALTNRSDNDASHLLPTLPGPLAPLPDYKESEPDDLPCDAPVLEDWDPKESLDGLHTYTDRPPLRPLIPGITFIPPQVTISVRDVMTSFRASILPFISPQALDGFEAGVHQFEIREGNQLQRLCAWFQYHESQPEPMGYTSRDSRIHTHYSYPFHLHNFVCLEDELPKANPLERAANLIYSAVDMIRAVRRGTFDFGRLPESKFYKRQYDSMFVPDWNDFDTSARYSHIVVMVEGQMHALTVLRGKESDLIWSRKDLVLHLKRIVGSVARNTEDQDLEPQAGVMTTVDSSDWTATRARIAALNPESIRTMDSAMFVVCLDNFVYDEIDMSQTSMTIGSYNMLKDTPSGSCFNRWHVGKLQLVVPKDGSIFMKFDDTCIDRQTAMRFAADIALDADIYSRRAIPKFSATTWPMWAKELSHPGDVIGPSTSIPLDMCWVLQWDPKIESLPAFKSIHDKLTPFQTDLNVAMETFTGFGSTILTANGISPGSFFQIAAQLAMVWLKNKVCTAKEVVTNTDISLGCTTTVWSSTMEVRILAALFYSNAKDEDVQFRLRLACQQHERLIFQAQNGFDWMKYLQFLECTQKMNSMARIIHPEPSFFEWSVYDKVRTAQLTTCRHSYDKVSHVYAPPEADDSVNVSYAIRDGEIRWTVCTTFGYAERYSRILWVVMERLRHSLKADEIVLPPDWLMTVAQNDIANFGDLCAARYRDHVESGVRVVGFNPNVLSVDAALEPTEVGEASSGEEGGKTISDKSNSDFV